MTHQLNESQKTMLTRGVNWTLTHSTNHTIAIDGNVGMIFTKKKTRPALHFNEGNAKTFLSRLLKTL